MSKSKTVVLEDRTVALEVRAVVSKSKTVVLSHYLIGEMSLAASSSALLLACRMCTKRWPRIPKSGSCNVEVISEEHVH